MAVDLFVVGLGNPGSEYAGTRHNVGVAVIDELARRHGGSFKRTRDRALVAEISVGSARVVLAFPQTYMNESGQAVAPLAKKHLGGEADRDLHRLVVVHDELDLAPGVLRVKVGGGLAGHNGLRSIKAHLHSDDFVRVRIGVGKPLSAAQGADYVLKKLSKTDREQLDQVVQRAADAIESILVRGAEATMAVFNAAPKSAE